MEVKPGAKVRVHYVPSTHWDREWYLPFQGFRFRLVKLVDGLLDLLEAKPEYRFFVFDGQTIVIDDYAEARPERKAELLAHVKSGRIVVGPWYVMPDERLLSGESLVRNLLIGGRKAREFGAEPMRYGYVCDIFGHISQFPQILNGFGITEALLGRGTNEHTHPANFVWEAPDGSEVVAFKIPDIEGYGLARRLWEASGKGAVGSEEWKRSVREAARAIFSQEKARTAIPLQLWLDGNDHQEPGWNIPESLEEARAALPEAEIVFSTLEAFAAEQRAYRHLLPRFRGELVDVAKKEGGFLWLIPHCLSSHFPMKQLNDGCQALLEKWAEPWGAWASLCGGRPTRGFLDLAWLSLVQNHPHDSIGGCSVDQVHKDTEYRYDQSRLLAREAFDSTVESVLPVQPSEKDLSLFIVSAYPARTTRVVEADLFWPESRGTKRFGGFSDDPMPNFRILDEQGREVPYQKHSVRAPGRHRPGNPLFDFGIEPRIRVSIEAELPGIGVRGFSVVESQKPVRSVGTLRTGTLRAENERLALEIQGNGSLTITDKQGGQSFEDLMVFEDTGEVGDGWFHVKPMDNRTYLSTGSATEIAVGADGPLVTGFVIEKTMMLPKGMDWPRLSRSAERAALCISADVVLRKGAAAVECTVRVDNTITDHRLRVLFPARVPGSTWFAGEPFGCVERRRGTDPSTHDWNEKDVEERSFTGYAGAWSPELTRGLALVAGEGLHEIAALDDRDGTLALTLFRSFRRTPAGPGTRSQLQHPMTFRFLLVPLSAPPDANRLAGMHAELLAGIESLMVRGRVAGGRDPLLVFAAGAVQLSAFKQAEDGKGFIMRVFNPTPEPRSDVARFGFPCESIEETRMDEEPRAGGQRGTGRELALELPPFAVRTFRLLPRRER